MAKKLTSCSHRDQGLWERLSRLVWHVICNEWVHYHIIASKGGCTADTDAWLKMMVQWRVIKWRNYFKCLRLIPAEPVHNIYHITQWRTLATLAACGPYDVRVSGSIPGLSSFNTITLITHAFLFSRSPVDHFEFNKVKFLQGVSLPVPPILCFTVIVKIRVNKSFEMTVTAIQPFRNC